MKSFLEKFIDCLDDDELEQLRVLVNASRLPELNKNHQDMISSDAENVLDAIMADANCSKEVAELAVENFKRKFVYDSVTYKTAEEAVEMFAKDIASGFGELNVKERIDTSVAFDEDKTVQSIANEFINEFEEVYDDFGNMVRPWGRKMLEDAMVKVVQSVKS